ncbi:hypothetical protein ACO0RG_004201 [Hanseniaspora osmophila]
MKKAILFMDTPEYTATYEELKSKFLLVNYSFPKSLTKDQDKQKHFIEFVDTQFDYSTGIELVGIYAGYRAFLTLEDGLTEELIMASPNLQHLQMVTLCSRGINKLPLDFFKSKGVVLTNYDDADNYVANDVADCAMWHVMEGFRKFSFQQHIFKKFDNVLDARCKIRGDAVLDEKFAFGHELSHHNSKALSPMNKKVLVLGFGKIAQTLCLKLKLGLNMDVYYSTRSGESIEGKKQGFKYFPWKQWEADTTNPSETKNNEPSLDMFDCIVNCLPGTKDTLHLIDKNFLQNCCPLNNLILVNVGRGNIFDLHVINDHAKDFRHLGLDVFYKEPLLLEFPQMLYENSTMTPHIGSSTDSCFLGASEYCLKKLLTLSA